MKYLSSIVEGQCIKPTAFILALAFFLGTMASLSEYLQLNAESVEYDEAKPHPFHISREELLRLVKILAPRVDLFSSVWKIDPKAEFYAGTTRDFLYWILGYFRGLTSKVEIEKAKAKLLQYPILQFRDMVGPDSDADIISNRLDDLRGLDASQFGIRKLDFLTSEHLNRNGEIYESEIAQGFIPVEKIRLSKNGIIEDPNFGNGISDLINGELSISFSEPTAFWKTRYAKEGSNHPVLLAARYIRILAQDYLRRHGNQTPYVEVLRAPMSKNIEQKIRRIIASALTDPKFKEFLDNPNGQRWLNGTIQKSFRSYSNADAAFELMKEFGLLKLIETFPEKLESIHQYLLKATRNEKQIRDNFSVFKLSPESIYQPLDLYLPKNELFHGTSSQLAFRNIIFQGLIPSDDGSAGRGFYGTSKRDLPFVRNWSLDRSDQDDLVIAIKLHEDTRLVDITKGSGKILFERWYNKQQEIQNIDLGNLYDQFCEKFGIDLLKYPYGDIDAYVLKNSSVIEYRRGVYKNPRSILELMEDARKMNHARLFQFLKDFFETSLTENEQNRILQEIPGERFTVDYLLSDEVWPDMKKSLGTTIGHILGYFWSQKSLSSAQNDQLSHRTLEILEGFAPHLDSLSHALTMAEHWPDLFWNGLARLLGDSSPLNRKRKIEISRLFQSRAPKQWPDKGTDFWKIFGRLFRSENLRTRREALETTAYLHRIKHPAMKQIIHRLASDPSDQIRGKVIENISTQRKRSPATWALIAKALVDPSKEVRAKALEAISMRHSIADTPSFIWILVTELLKERTSWITPTIIRTISSKKIWDEDLWKLLEEKSYESDLSETVGEALAQHRVWNRRAKTIISNLLQNPSCDRPLSPFVYLSHLRHWSTEIVLFASDLLRKATLPDPALAEIYPMVPSSYSRFIEEVAKRKKWSPELWQSIENLLFPERNFAWAKNSNSLVEVVKGRAEWPEHFWEHLSNILRMLNFNEELSHRLLKESLNLLSSRGQWPENIWASILRILLVNRWQISYPAYRSILEVVSQQNQWPQKFRSSIEAVDKSNFPLFFVKRLSLEGGCQNSLRNVGET